ncbi:hypothetical protein F5X97DRAFT_323525 [Nemania serpens]|nr:hypothetical protein F5X97DRAFT_323525 [Nemania serpens]
MPISLSQLKCSGQKTGCHRCKKLNRACAYVQNTTKKRKNKETNPKIDNKARRSSTSTSPSPSTTPPPASLGPIISVTKSRSISPPYPEIPPSDLKPPSLALPSALDQSSNDSGNTTSLNTNLMEYGPLEYHHLQDIFAMQMPDLNPRQNGDVQQPPWSEPPRENYLDSIEAPRAEAEMPSPLSSPADGWLLGTQSHNETNMAPMMRVSALEPVVSDVQTARLPPCPHACCGRDWLQYQTEEPCQCFQSVVYLFQEIHSGAIDLSAKDLGAWLSSYKEALRCCEALLMCSLCRVKAEYMLILGLLADRLIIMCDEAISAYLSTWAGNANGEINLNSAKDGAWVVYVDNFEINSLLEWRTLISTLLTIQLRRLDALMAQFKNSLWEIEGNSVCTRAESIQSQISALLERINQAQPDQDGFVVPAS